LRNKTASTAGKQQGHDCHSSFLRPWCQSPWTNTLPRHFRRGSASHKPFDFLSSIIYPFYMFLGHRSLGEGGYTAKTFSASRRVRNHYTKRILNLILKRKKILQRGNETETRITDPPAPSRTSNSMPFSTSYRHRQVSCSDGRNLPLRQGRGGRAQTSPRRTCRRDRRGIPF